MPLLCWLYQKKYLLRWCLHSQMPLSASSIRKVSMLVSSQSKRPSVGSTRKVFTLLMGSSCWFPFLKPLCPGFLRFEHSTLIHTAGEVLPHDAFPTLNKANNDKQLMKGMHKKVTRLNVLSDLYSKIQCTSFYQMIKL